MTETIITERQVKFLGRAKRYGKWEETQIPVPEDVDPDNLREFCENYLKETNDSDFAEVQNVITWQS